MISFDESISYEEKQEHYYNYSYYDLNQNNDQNFYEQFLPIFNEQQLSQEDDENYDKIYFKQDDSQNQQENIQSEKTKEIDNKKTKPTTITTPVKKIKEEKKEFILNKSIKDDNKAIPEEFLKKKRGRKNKDMGDIINGENIHSKNKEDNKMKKIRTHLIRYIVILLNDSLKDKSYKFHKINKLVLENLKIEYNLKLNQRTLLDLFSNEKICERYKNFSNEYLIKKLLKEQKEKDTLNLLELKFIEMINIIKKEYLDEFLDTIKQKEKNNKNSNIEEYIESLREIFLGYEDWFKNKKGRNREKNIKQE